MTTYLLEEITEYISDTKIAASAPISTLFQYGFSEHTQKVTIGRNSIVAPDSIHSGLKQFVQFNQALLDVTWDICRCPTSIVSCILKYIQPSLSDLFWVEHFVEREEKYCQHTDSYIFSNPVLYYYHTEVVPDPELEFGKNPEFWIGIKLKKQSKSKQK